MTAAADADDEQSLRRAEEAEQARRLAEHALFITDEEDLKSYREVWALMFNAGSGTEGIYSRRSGQDDLVLTFEDKDDADRYAEQLSASDFPKASSVQLEISMLLTFCHEGGHTLGLVKQGDLVIPPEQSVPEFSWSPGSSAEGTDEPETMSSTELDASRRALEQMFERGGDDEPTAEDP